MSRWIVVHKLPNSWTVSHFGETSPFKSAGGPTSFVSFVVLRHEKKGCSTSPFDCEAGYATWKTGWSPTKKAAWVDPDGWLDGEVGKGHILIWWFPRKSLGRHICKNFPEDGYIIFVGRDFVPSFHSAQFEKLTNAKEHQSACQIWIPYW